MAGDQSPSSATHWGLGSFSSAWNPSQNVSVLPRHLPTYLSTLVLPIDLPIRSFLDLHFSPPSLKRTHYLLSSPYRCVLHRHQVAREESSTRRSWSARQCLANQIDGSFVNRYVRQTLSPPILYEQKPTLAHTLHRALVDRSSCECVCVCVYMLFTFSCPCAFSSVFLLPVLVADTRRLRTDL